MNDTSLVNSLSALGFAPGAPGARVLDLGCGTGRHAQALARAGYRVVGVDSDVDAVETARAWAREDERAPAEGSPPAFLAARAESLPFSDAAFAAISCLDVLHWVADEDAFRALWSEAWRTLRPGGVLVARGLMREELPEAVPVAGAHAGRFRLAHGAEWFLLSRAVLDDVVARGAGTLVEPPCSVGAGAPGAARFVARKPG